MTDPNTGPELATATEETRQIIQLAHDAGQQPQWQEPVNGLALVKLLAQPDDEGGTGTITVDERTGRVLGGWFIFDEGAIEIPLHSADEVRSVLEDLLP